MKTREEYVAKLKSQLDLWNSQVAVWEAKSKVANAEAKAQYEAQIARFRASRDKANEELRRVQAASADAWSEMAKGADAAWKAMGEAFAAARSKFEKG